jgi:hypothetical protein
MTQHTYAIDTTLVGIDITASVFNSLMYEDLFADSQGYVVPGYLDSLQVEAGGTSGVFVRPGAAVVNNYLYVSDANEPLTIEPGTDPRCDAIVLRWIEADRTIRLAVVKGPANGYPTLTQTNTLWEVALAYVMLSTATDIDIQPEDMWDRREFLKNPTSNDYQETPPVILRNSEFIAYTDSPTSPAEYWTSDGSAVVASGVLYRSYYHWRGVAQGVRNGYVYQDVDITGRDNRPYTLSSGVYGQTHGGTNPYFNGWVEVEAYDAGNVLLKSFKQGAGPIQSSTPSVLGYAWQDRFTFHVPSGTTKLRVKLIGSAAIMAYFHYVQLCEGFFAPLSREFHEILMFDTAVTDTSWDSDSKGAGSTTIDFTTDFGGLIPQGVRGVIMYPLQSVQ